MSGGKTLDQIEIDLRGRRPDDVVTVYIDVYDNSLSRKWLSALNALLRDGYHLEKNYCFLGFVEHPRNGWYILNQVNRSIDAINRAELGYRINDYFDMTNVMTDEPQGHHVMGRNILQNRLNDLHRYFEDLQGISGHMSEHYHQADATIRWHIRQLNLLCHEFESWALSYRKRIEAPDWERPSQLMCWLNAPRFQLDEADYESFGIETLNRSLGGVFVGVNKAVGKHHWEVFNDEGRDSRVGELTTTVLNRQTEAAGDFDIEWGQDPSQYPWQIRKLDEFRAWLVDNGFDPEDRSLTIGHPKVGQVDLVRSFGSDNHRKIWTQLNTHLDVAEIRTGQARARYDYHWDDLGYQQMQISVIIKGNNP